MQSLTVRHSKVYAALWTEKLNLLNKQCFYRNNKIFCGIRSYNTCSNAVFRHLEPNNRFAARLLPWRVAMIRCSKLAQKFPVQVRQVATVVMETTHLVLSQLTNFSAQWIENWVNSERCELVKLCRINLSGPVFFETHCSFVLPCCHCDLYSTALCCFPLCIWSSVLMNSF